MEPSWRMYRYLRLGCLAALAFELAVLRMQKNNDIMAALLKSERPELAADIRCLANNGQLDG
ncbi:hypothetical protein ColLi_04475 [Colletotrichum liriopes]|uniref:Uncharacterized protein n=1 Tax=Colletotrichum liriopes TaxID=708192 RepID=A0AA37GJ26_9PEZI|nr:hypothetical protein ColLi_04475 [Colletotrichum liriopes]